MPRRILLPLVALFLALACFVPTLAADPTPDGEDDLPDNVERAKVTRVVDGDTIEVEIDGDEETVRLIGIDTPETVDPNTDDECYGGEASDHAKRLLQGRTVWLETDVSDEDRFDRLLRYVWFKGKSDGKYYLANEVLVRRGYAVVSTFPPDVEYVDRLTDAQASAFTDNIGLWPGCGGADTPLEVGAPAEPAVPVIPESAPLPDSDGDGIDDTIDNCTYVFNGDQADFDLNGLGDACDAAPVPAEPAPVIGGGCDPSYPTLCIPVGAADIDCPQAGASGFTVYQPDPHGFDGDGDGVGCE